MVLSVAGDHIQHLICANRPTWHVQCQCCFGAGWNPFGFWQETRAFQWGRYHFSLWEWISNCDNWSQNQRMWKIWSVPFPASTEVHCRQCWDWLWIWLCNWINDHYHPSSRRRDVQMVSRDPSLSSPILRILLTLSLWLGVLEFMHLKTWCGCFASWRERPYLGNK